MKFVIYIAAQVAFMSVLPGNLLADSYPYSGFFKGMRTPDMPPDELKARCALSFEDQRPDGTTRVYHIDLAYFKTSGKIKYVWFQNRISDYDVESKIESVRIGRNRLYPQSEGRTHYSLIRDIGNEVILFYGFGYGLKGRQQVAHAFVTGDLKYGDISALVRCPFANKTIRRYLSDEFTALGSEDIGNITNPDAEFFKTKIVADILRKLEQP